MAIIVGGQPMFTGYLDCRAVSLDQREYLYALTDGLVGRRIPFVKRRIHTEDLPMLAANQNLRDTHVRMDECDDGSAVGLLWLDDGTCIRKSGNGG